MSNTFGDTDSDVKSTLKTFHKNNILKIIFAHFNINSIRNKFDQLSDIIKGHNDVLMMSKSKLDNSFPDGQLQIEDYGAPFRLDQNKLEGRIMLFIRSDIPAKLLSADIRCESLFVGRVEFLKKEMAVRLFL